MANLPLTAAWDAGIYQIELDDPVEGDVNGIDNRQGKSLGNRSEFLKAQIDAAVGGNIAGADGFSLKMLNGKADQIDGMGRDLLKVLGVTTIQAAMAELRRRCNNNGEIAAGGVPDFGGIMVGDYIDGLDLSGIEAPAGGSAPQAWNNTYKNNRLLVSGFNTYKNGGDTENTKNHVVFTFRNVIARGRMRADNSNDGGYTSAKTEARTWLEGASGDGSGPLAVGLKAVLGGEYLYTVRRLLSTKGGWAWATCTLFLLSEREVWGCSTWGEADNGGGLPSQLPIFQRSGVYKGKRWNGARDWWWEENPSGSSAAYFCVCHLGIRARSGAASSVGGFAPCFCVA